MLAAPVCNRLISHGVLALFFSIDSCLPADEQHAISNITATGSTRGQDGRNVVERIGFGIRRMVGSLSTDSVSVCAACTRAHVHCEPTMRMGTTKTNAKERRKQLFSSFFRCHAGLQNFEIATDPRITSRVAAQSPQARVAGTCSSFACETSTGPTGRCVRRAAQTIHAEHVSRESTGWVQVLC